MVSGVFGVLDELAVGHPPFEVPEVQKVIVDAVQLTVPRGASGRRYRQLEARHLAEQPPDQRAFADAGGTGDDNDRCRHGPRARPLAA